MTHLRPAVAGFLLALALLASCARPPDKLTLTRTTFAALPGWESDDPDGAFAAFNLSCAPILSGKLALETPIGPGGIAGTVADWQSPCAEAARLRDFLSIALVGDADGRKRQLFEAWFIPYKAGNNGRTQGLFTGYYEPELRGARQPGGAYTTPLLRRPPDLVMVELALFRPDWRGERIAGHAVNGRLLPFESRAEIEHGALDRQHLAFLWVDDPVDAFFLQIQGSGRVRLPDGTMVQVGYDGQNGKPYVPIGRLLLECGALERDNVSMQAIRAWIKANPEAGAALMAENPSYVFFREITGDGPIGAQGVALTAQRSLAVDRDFVPLGVPVWLDAGEGAEKLQRLMVAQDTGGAIRGPVRGDVFWGFGSEAEARAGTMKAAGEYYLLLPKTVTVAPAS
jgi:membrane-bound lytic murein transglycosylase A